MARTRATTSEIVAFADTDTEDFHRGSLLGCSGHCSATRLQLVKGTFRRPFRNGDTVLAEGGGRVTELMARPLLNLHAPELAVFDQPLAGETAARRALLEQIPFSAGYGVEIAMLIDCWRACGLDALAQVDLGKGKTATSRCATSPRWPTPSSSPPKPGSSAKPSPTATLDSMILPPTISARAMETRQSPSRNAHRSPSTATRRRCHM